MLRWKPFSGEDCLFCGGEVKVLTNSTEDDTAFDGDTTRCVGCGCPGMVSADADGVSIAWHDDPECNCNWCRRHPIG